MPTGGRHTHTCETCRHEWACLHVKCQTAHAAKVNKQGPFCGLCLHLEMARRFAEARGITLKVKQAKIIRKRLIAPQAGDSAP